MSSALASSAKTSLGNIEAFLAEVGGLGKTAAGHPKHPLYLRADSQLIDYP